MGHTSLLTDHRWSVPAVFAGTKAGDFFEGLVKIGSIMKATFFGDVEDRPALSILIQKRNGFINAFGIDIVPESYAAELFKERTKIIWGQTGNPGKFGQGDLFAKMSIQIGNDTRNSLLVFMAEL